MLPLGRVWDAESDSMNMRSRTGAHDALIHVHNDSGDVIETHEHGYPAGRCSTIKLRYVGQREAKSNLV